MDVLFERYTQARRWHRWLRVRCIVVCSKCTWEVMCSGLPTGSTASIAVVVWTVRVRLMFA